MTELFEACEDWPKTPEQDIRSPFLSDVPVLVIAGEMDPVTPPENAVAMARLFRRSHVVIAAHGGHDFPPASCLAPMIARFLDSGQASRECETTKAPPFYVP